MSVTEFEKDGVIDLVRHFKRRVKSMETEVTNMFQFLDTDNNGTLDRQELKSGVTGLGLLLT